MGRVQDPHIDREWCLLGVCRAPPHTHTEDPVLWGRYRAPLHRGPDLLGGVQDPHTQRTQSYGVGPGPTPERRFNLQVLVASTFSWSLSCSLPTLSAHVWTRRCLWYGFRVQCHFSRERKQSLT